jgi:hypothetical protein
MATCPARRHIAHACTQETITAGVNERLKKNALSALNERLVLVGKVRDEAGESGRSELANSLSMKANAFERESGVISRLDRLNGTSSNRVGHRQA